MRPNRGTHSTRTARERREFWKRFWIWMLILVFGVGSAVLGLLTVFVNGSAR